MIIPSALNDNLIVNNKQLDTSQKSTESKYTTGMLFGKMLSSMAYSSFSAAKLASTSNFPAPSAEFLPEKEPMPAETKNVSDSSNHIEEEDDINKSDIERERKSESAKQWQNELLKLQAHLQNFEKSLQPNLFTTNNKSLYSSVKDLKQLLQSALNFSKGKSAISPANQKIIAEKINTLINQLKATKSNENTTKNSYSISKLLVNFQEKTGINTNNSKVFLPGVDAEIQWNSTVQDKLAQQKPVNAKLENAELSNIFGKHSMPQDGVLEARNSDKMLHANGKLAKNIVVPTPVNVATQMQETVSSAMQLQLKAARHQVRLTGNFTGNNHLKFESAGNTLLPMEDGVGFGGKASKNGFSSLFAGKSQFATAKFSGVSLQQAVGGFGNKGFGTNSAALKGQPAKAQVLSATLNVSNSNFSATSVTASAKHVRAEEIIDKIVGQIKLAYSGGREVISIKLQPAHLGNVDVWMKKQNGKLSLRLKVENKEVLASVNARMETLRSTLKQVGIDITDIKIDLAEPITQPISGGSIIKTTTKENEAAPVVNGVDSSKKIESVVSGEVNSDEQSSKNNSTTNKLSNGILEKEVVTEVITPDLMASTLAANTPHAAHIKSNVTPSELIFA